MNVSTSGEPAPGQHLMSEAIRDHQRPSEDIRGHQRPSEVIRGHQRPSEAIRFGARPAPIADDHVVQSQSVAISRHQSPSVAINAPIADDHVVAHGCVGVTDAPDEGAHQRPSEVIRVHQVGVTDARSPGFARREGERHQSPSDAISRNQCNGRTFARPRAARRRLGR